MADRDIRERDILVAPNEFAYVQDLTKGDIVLYVGPTKISLSNTERMIVNRDGRFEPVRGDEAGTCVHRFIEASSGQYIVLDNPPKDASAQPVKGANSAIALDIGRTVVVPGPVEFPLWPGQRARVVDGHRLKESEYLVVRVYEEGEDGSPIGTEQIIRGTDTSFYVPRTGLEVVPNKSGHYVRTAWRLDPKQGLHLRVTSPFESDGTTALPAGNYLAGQDIFLRGGGGFFFPTENLEVIGQVSAIPLADKEAIYVRALDSGKINTVVGPTSYLVDPTTEELVEREMSDELRELYGIEGEPEFRAPSVYIPPSTAVLVVAPNRREVVTGPQMRVLDYDEELEVLELSTGRPKSDDDLLPTCFLQVQGNKVSDRVFLQTADHVDLELMLSYRVSFVGDNERWFSVKDYVGLLCDHLASIIRATGRAHGIEKFHRESASILRRAILGEHAEQGERAGRHFSENGMWVYDLEILDVNILDEEVKGMLWMAQRKAIASAIARNQEELRLGDEALKESVDLQIFQSKVQTLKEAVKHEAASRELELAKSATRLEIDRQTLEKRAENRAQALRISSQADYEAKKAMVELEEQSLRAQAEAFARQMDSLGPELIRTLRQLGNQKLAGELSKNLAPMALLGGTSVAEVAGQLLDKLPLGESAKGDTWKALFDESLLPSPPVAPSAETSTKASNGKSS